MQKNTLILLSLFFCLGSLRAQDWEFGLLGGASGYMGELNPNNPVKFNDWAAGILVKNNITRTWAVRANLMRANIWGEGVSTNDSRLQRQRLQFESPLYEFALLGEFNFFKYEASYMRRSYTPYLFAGVGATHFQPKNYDFVGERVNLRDYETEGVRYNTVTLSIPFGVGFKYNFKGPWTLGAEVGYRFVFTDYLDDISGDYLSLNEIPDPQRAYFIDPSDFPKYSTTNIQRGDGRRRDAYMAANLTLTYTIFKAGCPIIMKR